MFTFVIQWSVWLIFVRTQKQVLSKEQFYMMKTWIMCT